MDKLLFGKRLSERRRAKGYENQNQFAKAYDEKYPPRRRKEDNGSLAGFYGSLKNYEGGGEKCNPKLETVDNICKMLDCSVDYLLGNIKEDTHDRQFVCNFTGLSGDAIKSLEELSKLDKPIKDAVFKFLDDLLDSQFLLGMAVAYQKYVSGAYKGGMYSVVDETGNFVDMVDGDISIMVLQNAFNKFVYMQPSKRDDALKSRAAMRQYWNKLKDEEKEEILLQAEIDRRLGK